MWRNQDPLAPPDTLSGALSKFVNFSRTHKKHLDALVAERVQLPARTDLIIEGDPIRRLPIVVEGWVAQYHLLHDGRRSILKLNLPGDIIDGTFPLIGEARYSAVTLTHVVALMYPARELAELLRSNARIATAFLLMEAYQHSFLRERVMTLARLSAYERLGHLCLELLTRLEAIGLARDDGFAMPLSQVTIGELLGMHEVHVNRMLHRLEADGYIARGNGRIHIRDREALAQMVEFRPLRIARPVDAASGSTRDHGHHDED